MRWKRVLGITILAGIIVGLTAIVILATYDFNRLKPRIAEAVKTHSGLVIQFNGDLKLGFGLTPRLTVQSATLQNASWGSRPDFVRIKQLELQVELLPLVLGTVKVKRLALLEPDILIEVNASGETNLAFHFPEIAANVLAIREVDIDKAKVSINDHRTRKTTILDIGKFTLKATGYTDPPDVNADAVFNDTPLRISGSTGPISDFFKKAGPWPIKLIAKASGADITIDGAIDDPMRLRGADLKFSASGTDLSTLDGMAGRSLPASPFGISGHLVYSAPEKMEVTGLQLKLADSTVNGNAAVERIRGVPLIVARLESDRLDLRPLLGNDNKTSPEEMKSDRAARKKVFSDAPFTIDILSRFETSVDAKIASLILPGFIAEKIDVKATLKSSRLNVRLIASKIGGGRLSFDLDLVPVGKEIDVSTSVIAKSVNLSLMLRGLKIQSAMEGILDLTAGLKGRGTSVAALMAGLDGDFIAILSNGRMPLTYLNLIGTDIGSSLVHLLNPFGDPVDEAALNCLVVDFNIAKGQAKSDVLLIDDLRKTLIGLAEVDLKTEDLDVWIESKPKEGIGVERVGKVSVSLKELTKPFKLGGTLAHPGVELDTMKTAKTIGTALLGPAGVAWLLVSGSSGKEAPCTNALKIAGEGAYKKESGSGDKGAAIK
jgi:AsmA family protein